MADAICPEGAQRLCKAATRDLLADRHEYVFKPPGAGPLTSLLSDPRDAPILYLFINVATLSVPCAAALFVWAPTSHAWGAAYFAATYALFLQRFMLALHYSEHRRLFKHGFGALNLVAPLLLAPFFGIPAGMYRLHHCVMHHVFNNAAGADLSSTEPFQRDNPLHFLLYWGRHALGGPLEVPLHAARAHRWGLLGACVATEVAYAVALCLLWRLAPVATTWAFLLPYAVSSLALMFGNWSQHIFIDPAAPRSNYGLTYNCVGCADNQRSFNDGYHILHHHNSQLHWTQFPRKLTQQGVLEEHAAAGALVFEGVGFFDVGAAVFAGRWDRLQLWLVRYSQRLAGMSDEQVVAMLKARLRPIHRR